VKLLDLFSCAGGAAMGYAEAGFEVTGIDIDPQPNYPFRFHQADALTFLAEHGHEYDAIHASPPCQASSALTKGTNRTTRAHLHVDLIAATRDALAAIGLPYVIENVQGAKVRHDLTLCGEMFSLGVIRHRYFELGGWSMPVPRHIKHRGRVAGWRHGAYYDGPYRAVYGDGGGKGSVAEWQQAMGIFHTDVRRELAEAIPPAYARFVGAQLFKRCTHA